MPLESMRSPASDQVLLRPPRIGYIGLMLNLRAVQRSVSGENRLALPKELNLFSPRLPTLERIVAELKALPL